MHERLLGVASVCILIAAMLSRTASAMDLLIARTGLASVGENQVQFDSSKLTVEKAYQQGGITLPNDSRFSIYENTDNRFAPADYIDNNVHFVGYLGAADAENAITNEELTFRWSKAAKLSDGAELDVVMRIYNIHILQVASSVSENAPVALAADWTTETGLTRFHHSSYRANAYYDVAVELYRPGTNSKVSKDAVFIIRDLDAKSRTVETTCENSLNAEGVYLTTSILDATVYVTDDTTVLICDSEFGANTRFVGTVIANNEESSSLSFRMNTSNARYRWTGTNRETEVGFANASAVETSLIGDNADKGTITESDREVLWKAQKIVRVTPSSGYHVGKIYVDKEETEFTPNNDGTVDVVLSNVVSDHLVQAMIEEGDFVPPASTDETDNSAENPATLDPAIISAAGLVATATITVVLVRTLARRR